MLPDPFAEPFAPLPSATARGGGTTSSTGTNMHVNATKVTSILPSLPTLSAFLLSHFPQLSPMAAAVELPWLYHSPLPPRRQQRQTMPGVQPQPQPPRPLPARSGVQRLVLSITPTEGVYAALGAAPLPPLLDHPLDDTIAHPASAEAAVPSNFKPSVGNRNRFTTAAFLHRPWTLTRGRLPHGTTVWTSHKAFDEGLTTGYNLALLGRLGANVQTSKVLQGYKGDEGRRIGMVAGFGEIGRESLELDDIRGRIIAEFGDLQGEGAWFGFGDGSKFNTINDGAPCELGAKEPGKVTSIACMNAFHPAEVDRVAAAAVETGLAGSPEDCSGLLYLTGAANEEGVEAALRKGMKVVCVGHRLCEVWGIGYLADRVREKWPDVDVQVVDEEEVKPPPKEKKEVKPQSNKKAKTAPKQKLQKDVPEAEVERTANKIRTSSEDENEDGGVML